MPDSPSSTAFQSVGSIPVDATLARQRRRILAALTVEMFAVLAVFGGLPAALIVWTSVACSVTLFGVQLAAMLFRLPSTIGFAIAMGIPCLGLLASCCMQFGEGVSESFFREVVYVRIVGIVTALFIVFASRRIPGRQLPAMPEDAT